MARSATMKKAAASTGKRGAPPSLSLRCSREEIEYLKDAAKKDGHRMLAPWIMQVLRKKAQDLLGRESPALSGEE
jgi:uncharacterized protein (DUF1778 family)